MMEDPLIEIPAQLDDETAKRLSKLTKDELIEKLCSLAVESKTCELRCKTAMDEAASWKSEAEILQERLGKAEAYVEQGRSMIEAVMERWFHYDT